MPADTRARRFDVHAQLGDDWRVHIGPGVDLSAFELQVWVQPEVDDRLAAPSIDAAAITATIDDTDAATDGVWAVLAKADIAGLDQSVQHWIVVNDAAQPKVQTIGRFRATAEGTASVTSELPMVLGDTEVPVTFDVTSGGAGSIDGGAPASTFEGPTPRRVQMRRGTTAQWTGEDPVLAAGEWGAEYDTDGALVSVRIGDGTSTWSALTALGAGSGTGLPEGGTEGQVPVVVDDEGTTGWLSRNAPDGYAGLDEDGTLADVLHPDSIARDSEVAAAVAAHNASGSAHPDLRTASTGADDPILDLDPAWYINAGYTATAPAVVESIASRLALGDEGAAALAGIVEVPDLSGGNRPAENAAGGAAPIAAGSWDGELLLGQWTTTATADWPSTELDFECVTHMLPSRRDPAAQWSEIMLATIDEVEDYLEPAFLFLETGIHFGLDYRHGDVEATWNTTEPLPDPFRPHRYRLTVDCTTGELSIYIDGVLFETDTLPDAPFTLDAPTVGDTIYANRLSLASSEIRLSDSIGGAPVYEITAADQTGWTAAGAIVSEAFTTPRFIKGTGIEQWEAPSVDIAAASDFTWAIRGNFWPGAGGVWWSSNPEGPFGGADGWAFAAYAGFGIGFAFLIGDGGAPVLADAGAIPAGEVLVIAELDRDAGELRLIIDGVTEATADASGLGAVATANPQLFGNTYGSFEYMASFSRLLTSDEKAVLATAGTTGRIATVQGRQGPHVDLSDVFATKAYVDAAIADALA